MDQENEPDSTQKVYQFATKQWKLWITKKQKEITIWRKIKIANKWIPFTDIFSIPEIPVPVQAPRENSHQFSWKPRSCEPVYK